MSNYYNKNAIPIKSISPTLGLDKTKKYKKELEIKNRNKSSKNMFKKKFNKGGRVGLKEGSPKKKKLNQGDILGNRFDKKFKKLALSKEAQLHAKDYDAGLDRAEKRAAKEVAQEAGLPMAKGGRVGLKRGTGLMPKRKSNVQKIKETFGPKQKPQSRMTGKKKKFPDLTGDGKVTFADILKGRGVKRG